jgi:phospholipid N-methyltransferase
MSYWQEFRAFARTSIRHPLMIGAMFPSSPYLVRHVLEEIDFNNALVVVEYGPGVGTFTRQLLARMRPDAKLLAIETNADFVTELRAALSDPRLHIAHASAENVGTELAKSGFAGADYIISGIPFTALPDAIRRRILLASREALNENGKFLVYQYTRAILPGLRKVFGAIRCKFEPRNILPAQVFVCEP